jgi:signal transduction histidine kinase
MAEAPRAAWPVVTLFLLAVGLLALVGLASADLLSAARAYVGGESQWSKARVTATSNLREHLRSGDAAALQAFRRALAVSLGDRRARLELDQPRPDAAVVHAGFIAGGIDPDDVPGMARLYRYLGQAPAIARAIEVWVAADDDMAQLQVLADQAAAGVPGRGELLSRLDALEARLQTHELEFSRRLGEASRQAVQVVQVATAALAVALAAMVGWFANATLSRLARAEQAQRRANARWDLAAEAARIGIFEWNRSSRMLDADPRCLVLHGLPADAPRLQPVDALFDRVHPEDRAAVRAANRAGVAGDAMWSVPFRTLQPDGSYRHLELAARRRDPDARVVVGLVRDATAEVQARTLRLQKEAAEQASEAKSRFLSRASHELRTPLNAVLGFAQVMAADAKEPLGAGQQRRLAFVTRAGEHLLRLVDDLLDLSSAERGEHAIQLAPVPVQALLQAVVALLEPLATMQDVRVELQAPQPVLARADRTRLDQVLVNLLSNAIKYNRPGGHVTLVLAQTPDHVVIDVRDDGIGMTAEQVDSLFQPFNRLGAEQRGIEGVGLGLVVSRSLVQAMGGTLVVASLPRRGTTVTVALPRLDAPPA